MKTFTGLVIKGKGRAAKLGFPTANIVLDDDSLSGIYAARVKIGDAEYIATVFADPKRKILEAHLLDYSGDLSGKNITIELCEKIRESKKFADDAKLREAIASDIVKVREYFTKES